MRFIQPVLSILSLLGCVVLMSAGGASAATLSLVPASGTQAVGEALPVAIHLDTEGAAIDGADALLTYDPAKLSLADESPSVAGTQIAAGSLMPNVPWNTADTTAGTVSFSQVTAGGMRFTGSGTLATMRFTPVAAGTTDVSFDFTPGSTTDSNVAANAGEDILSAAEGAAYRIVADGSSPPIPEPTGAAAFLVGFVAILPALKKRKIR